ncbi:MAG: hypothetical protein KAR03_03395 [Candidatus Thorarchaeota archaeon]|nr:hypothetical protein [Candidatus Thorarchaeota archaeon]
MQTDYSTFIRTIVELIRPISTFFQNNLGLPFGPEAWIFILIITPLLLIIILLVVRGRRSGGLGVDEGIKKIIASTGDVSSGMAGVKKLKFVRTPAEALVFLKVEENAIQQALSAVDYYAEQGDIDEALKTKFVQAYQDRLEAVRSAIDKDEAFKEIVDTSSAVDRARSDYLQKLAAMSGTAVETDDSEKAGPSSVGMPSSTETTTPTTGAPSETAPSGEAPSGGPPGGGAPSGGEAPSGGPPGGDAPSGGAPSEGPPGGGAPGGGPPDGEAPSGGPPGGGAPSGGAPPGGSVPGGSPPGGAPSEAAPKATGGKSSLQSEMLQEMERLKALMGGD